MRRLSSIKVVVVIGTLLFVSCGRAVGPDRGKDSSIAGKLTVLKGDAAVISKGTSTSVRSKGTADVREGDMVVTQSDSEAVVSTGSQVHLLGPDSTFRIDAHLSESPTAGARRITLLKGLATFVIRPDRGFRRFQAHSRTLVAAVKGTVFLLEAGERGSRVTVVVGEVEVRPKRLDAVDPLPEAPSRLVSANERVLVIDGQLKDDPPSKDEIAKITRNLMQKKDILKIDISTF